MRFVVAGIFSSSLLLLAAVPFSPLILQLLAENNDVDWGYAAEVAQAYGPASTLLSAAALGGVTISLLVQNREARANRNHSQRTFHHELLKMAMDDLIYLECWGPRNWATIREEKQSMYVNLIISFWQMDHESGRLNDKLLGEVSEELFRGRAGRSYWNKFGDKRITRAQTSKQKRFVRILNNEFKKANMLDEKILISASSTPPKMSCSSSEKECLDNAEFAPRHCATSSYEQNSPDVG
ncbi:DUF6082 family protein [Haloechinothrix salitolerans]|uniref:DUF6082 family protein n=1 Tax=Haloechinothrix salitolerans TaxID=926830 RepID=A0ABW2BZ65_9PSEU